MNWIFSSYFAFSDGYPPVVFPCMQVMVETLNLHVVASSWDVQILGCLSESSRTKTAAIR